MTLDVPSVHPEVELVPFHYLEPQRPGPPPATEERPNDHHAGTGVVGNPPPCGRPHDI